MKRILSIAAAVLLASTALPALAQSSIEGEVGVGGKPDIMGNPVPEVEQADPSITGSIELSTEQQADMRTLLLTNAVPVEGEFEVSIGAAVPDTVTVQPLPPRFVELVPQYDGYRYFVLADGRIVIVEPDTLAVVQIMS